MKNFKRISSFFFGLGWGLSFNVNSLKSPISEFQKNWLCFCAAMHRRDNFQKAAENPNYSIFNDNVLRVWEGTPIPYDLLNRENEPDFNFYIRTSTIEALDLIMCHILIKLLGAFLEFSHNEVLQKYKEGNKTFIDIFSEILDNIKNVEDIYPIIESVIDLKEYQFFIQKRYYYMPNLFLFNKEVDKKMPSSFILKYKVYILLRLAFHKDVNIYLENGLKDYVFMEPLVNIQKSQNFHFDVDDTNSDIFKYFFTLYSTSRLILNKIGNVFDKKELLSFFRTLEFDGLRHKYQIDIIKMLIRKKWNIAMLSHKLYDYTYWLQRGGPKMKEKGLFSFYFENPFPKVILIKSAGEKYYSLYPKYICNKENINDNTHKLLLNNSQLYKNSDFHKDMEYLWEKFHTEFSDIFLFLTEREGRYLYHHFQNIVFAMILENDHLEKNTLGQYFANQIIRVVSAKKPIGLRQVFFQKQHNALNQMVSILFLSRECFLYRPTHSRTNLFFLLMKGVPLMNIMSFLLPDGETVEKFFDIQDITNGEKYKEKQKQRFKKMFFFSDKDKKLPHHMEILYNRERKIKDMVRVILCGRKPQYEGTNDFFLDFGPQLKDLESIE